MNISQQHTKVLIVGAGPSGLMMAAQLLRYGIQPVIIDSKQGPTNHSKALIVQARSLEIYRQMGLIDKVLPAGKPAGSFAFCEHGRENVQLDINRIEGVDTPFPYLFVYPQSSNERLLLEYLTINCCPVYWNTTLSSISQHADVVSLTLQNGEQTRQVTADWVVAADGAHSPIRKALKIAFNGDTYKNLFYLIDAKVNGEHNPDVIRTYWSKKGLTGFFPMPDKGYYRIIGNIPDDLKIQGDELQLTDILPLLREVVDADINITDTRWIITYKLHHRMGEAFRLNRCFLIGDAAHIHSPVGGQGMNTGLQDAYNLAWKLGLVINNKVSNQLLDSYANERMPVAKTLLKTTDKAFNLAISSNIFARFFRLQVLPRLLRYLWSNASIKQYFFRAVSQTGISYPESPLSLHLSSSKKIKAGDRLPYLKVYDEKKLEETDLHQWCSKPGFTLIILGKVIEEEIFKIAKWLTLTYNGEVNFFYLPPSAKNQPVFDAFEIAKNQHLSMLVRPDMHIGYLNNAIDLDRMDRYMTSNVQMSKHTV